MKGFQGCPGSRIIDYSKEDGLVGLAAQALAESDRKVPVRAVVAGLQGEVLREEWLESQEAGR